MKCSQIRKKLSAYLDDEVSERDKKVMSEHLKHCLECQKELSVLSNVVDSISALQGMKVPPFFMTHLRQRMREEAEPIPFLQKMRRFTMSAATAIAVVVSLLIGNQIGRTLYHSVAGTTVQQISETTDVLGIGTFEEFPDGSLSDFYNELVAGGNNG